MGGSRFQVLVDENGSDNGDENVEVKGATSKGQEIVSEVNDRQLVQAKPPRGSVKQIDDVRERKSRDGVNKELAGSRVGVSQEVPEF